MGKLSEEKYKIYVEIGILKTNLINTDYQAIKFAEGIITAEEYEEIKAQRQAWRNKINELENKICSE